jgi:hypothetical protein
MREDSARESSWSVNRWIIVVLAVFAIQVGFIFWRGDGTHVSARRNISTLVWRMADPSSAEILALQDPTLFLLPHQNGFSGLAWMHPIDLPSPSFFWTEEPCWLVLSGTELGGTFNRFIATNDFGRLRSLALSEPSLDLPDVPKRVILPQTSSLTVEGSLSTRSLLTRIPRLTVWAHNELLTNSVVQIVIDHEGRPAAPGTLLVSSGLAKADQDAVDRVRTIRFNALKGEMAVKQGLMWGTLVFRWASVPLPQTNSPGASSDRAHP